MPGSGREPEAPLHREPWETQQKKHLPGLWASSPV
jgi:hypothetical protein